MYPKSCAARFESNERPMLVGEVRCATTAVGCSWKLSGGNQFDSALTNCSKKSHVFRADLWRNKFCASERSDFFSVSFLLKRHAIAGAPSHNKSIGAATNSAAASK